MNNDHTPIFKRLQQGMGMGILVGTCLGAVLMWVFMVLLPQQSQQAHANSSHADHDPSHEQGAIYTCSMHPQIQQSEPGDCPICGMDLIIQKKESHGTAPNPNTPQSAQSIQLSPSSQKLAQIQTTPVTLQSVSHSFWANGRVTINEDKVLRQSAHYAGRVEALQASYLGKQVQAGFTMAKLYSPQLQVWAQEWQNAHQLQDSTAIKRVHQKLKNAKLSATQIQNVTQNNSLDQLEHFSLLAEQSGILQKIFVKAGDYIAQGAPLWEIVPLHTVWVHLNVYEQDIHSLRMQDSVTLVASAYPEKTWQGTIQFINPIMDAPSGTFTVRVQVPNANGLLKPNMNITAQVQSQPVQALVIPRSAVLWTGTQSLVYVQHPHEPGVYEHRKITLDNGGQAIGNYYAVHQGVTAGEMVATHGVFTVDAAAQLNGKVSMISSQPAHNHGEASAMQHSMAEVKSEPQTSAPTPPDRNLVLDTVLQNYVQWKNHLTQDDLTSAKASYLQMQKIIAKPSQAHINAKLAKDLKGVFSSHPKPKSIEQMREAFRQISKVLIPAISGKYSYPEYYIQYCPMVLNPNNEAVGGQWISDSQTIRNPYFGASMLNCGEVQKSLQ
jgi:membrane fusion protein, copper/silver efflux system